jgi:2-hydroxy-6-oxonona-2,4-dienedioate hydrolase
MAIGLTEAPGRRAPAARRPVTPCGDGTMVWHVWGSGRPLVLQHGGYGSWTHWVRNIRFLAERRRVIAADLPGLGDSAAAPEPYTAESLASIVVEGIRRILPEDERFDLCGFSFGGLLGGHVAAQLGERVERLILVGPGGLGLPRRGGSASLRSWRDEPDAAKQREIHRENLGFLMFADPGKIDEPAVSIQQANARRGRTKSIPIAQTAALARVLPQIKARIAGIWGERDVTATPYLERRGQLLRSVQPDAPFIVIADAGHWVAYEAADAFNEVLATLLDG